MMWKIYDQSEKLSVVDHMFAPKMIELPETVGKIEYAIIFKPRPKVDIFFYSSSLNGLRVNSLLTQRP